ncbi:MAG: anaerobic ribonucleoside-triphosphate reductase activating protein [Candidatus Ancillula sp.]|jgi:pyruvate formate lyase activating enzyme|nr:anaerobic ribonucleoside-triphosphate reductase activating protein [Candidatus Ancillula sp.]
MNRLNIAGWTKLSTVDWPGNIVTSIFLQGCPWRCSYCHNYQILDPKVQGQIQFEDILEFLRNRVGLLDGVIFSGGEALMQAGENGALLNSIKEILAIGNSAKSVNAVGYKIGLHTAGAYPSNLRRVLEYIDWIGFDIKAPTGLYDAITNVNASEIAARKSLNLILAERELRKNTDHPLNVQFRTTIDPFILDDSAISRLKEELLEKGIDDLVLQEVRSEGTREEYAKKLSAQNQK